MLCGHSLGAGVAAILGLVRIPGISGMSYESLQLADVGRSNYMFDCKIKWSSSRSKGLRLLLRATVRPTPF